MNGWIIPYLSVLVFGGFVMNYVMSSDKMGGIGDGVTMGAFMVLWFIGWFSGIMMLIGHQFLRLNTEIKNKR